MVKKVKIHMLAVHEDGSEEFLMQCYTRETECAVMVSMPNAVFVNAMWEGMRTAIDEAMIKAVGEAKPEQLPLKGLRLVNANQSKH